MKTKANLLKSIFIVIYIFISITSHSQKIFLNTNNEKCIELNYANTLYSNAILYLVLDEETKLTMNDSTILFKWSTFSSFERECIIRSWSQRGYRIEIENKYNICYLEEQPFMKKRILKK